LRVHCNGPNLFWAFKIATSVHNKVSLINFRVIGTRHVSRISDALNFWNPACSKGAKVKPEGGALGPP
jgi:hypothetical protein